VTKLLSQFTVGDTIVRFDAPAEGKGAPQLSLHPESLAPVKHREFLPPDVEIVGRFRRAFICHYVPKSTERISKFYLPLLSPDGEGVMIEANNSGGACGNNWQNGVSWQGGTH